MSTVIGTVDKNGNVVSGAGFSVSNLDTGVYKITFSPAFTSAPTVVASLTATGLDSDQNNNVLMVDPGTSTTTVYITNSDSDGGQNGGFTFMASNG